MGKRRRTESESDEGSDDMDGEHEEGMDEEEDGKESKRRRKENTGQNGSGQQGDGSVSGPMRIREGWSKRRREEVVGKKRLLKERNFRDKNMGRGKFAKNWSR